MHNEQVLSLSDNSPRKPQSVFSHEYIAQLIQINFPTHPFEHLKMDLKSWKATMAEYLAMSMAFPYLQAGSCERQVLRAIEFNESIRPEMELTSVVGAFLVWDEFGGWFNTSQRGIRGLPRILDTRAFHANILKADLQAIFQEEIKPNFGPKTKHYLLSFHEQLCSDNDIVRCASMTSFETHAERMITALWKSIHESIGIEKKTLRYFLSHVGGNDPAEAYHVQMTESLIGMLTKEKEQESQFEKTFLACYRLHHEWCGAISESTYVV